MHIDFLRLLFLVGVICPLMQEHSLRLKRLISPQAAQAHYLWVRASEVIWSECTRIISVLSDAK